MKDRAQVRQPGESQPRRTVVAERETSIYRPWETRFELKPYNVSSVYSGRPENRAGYRAFAKAHPRHALAPNSVDRDAESAVALTFAVAVIGTIVSFMGLLYILQDQERALSATTGFLVVAVAPWVLITTWVFFVVYENFWSPVRESVAGSYWQCNAMLWYLILTPLFGAAAYLLHVMGMRDALLGRKEATVKPPDGPSPAGSGPLPREDGQSKGILAWTPPPWAQAAALFLEFTTVVFGIVLVFFSGPHSDFCEPQVWWTAAALASLSMVVLSLAIAVLLVGLCLWRLTAVPDVHSMVASFSVAVGGSGDVPEVHSMHDVEGLFQGALRRGEQYWAAESTQTPRVAQSQTLRAAAPPPTPPMAPPMGSAASMGRDVASMGVGATAAALTSLPPATPPVSTLHLQAQVGARGAGAVRTPAATPPMSSILGLAPHERGPVVGHVPSPGPYSIEREVAPIAWDSLEHEVTGVRPISWGSLDTELGDAPGGHTPPQPPM